MVAERDDSRVESMFYLCMRQSGCTKSGFIHLVGCYVRCYASVGLVSSCVLYMSQGF